MACSLCNHYSIVVTAFEIIRTINYKIPRTSSRHRNNQEVPFTVERDLKLMTSILAIEHYTLIMLGAITVSKEVFKESNVYLKI
ncbi:uncharacterized protein LOC105203045 [Solenopsis invicta]|uniref:uncharacterized protein LOC105203045 n=1 Tax=Solenopsis invicta TaxID=13686 RepID=UPI00193DF6C5|nr:uncharacterized protein LOC105203045 [Solenopsis invicta]